MPGVCARVQSLAMGFTGSGSVFWTASTSRRSREKAVTKIPHTYLLMGCSRNKAVESGCKACGIKAAGGEFKGSGWS